MTFYTFADKGGQQVPANQLDSNFATLLAQTEAASSLIASHVADTNNPHNTTAAQVGAQPSSAILSSLAGLTASADKLAYFTGASSLALADLAAYSRGLLADADAATWRGDLDVYSTSEVAHVVQDQGGNYASDTGSANAYVATFSPAVTAHTVGRPLRVKIANTCNGASTFNPGPGVKPIVNQDGSAVSENQIVADGIYTFVYDGTNYQYVSPRVAVAQLITTGDAVHAPSSDVLYNAVPVNPVYSFGAKGDGVTDDRLALTNALQSGKIVDGGGLTYGVYGNIVPLAMKGLQNCTLKQLNPTASDAILLDVESLNNFFVRDVVFDLGGYQGAGPTMATSGGLFLHGCDRFKVYRNTVQNGGKQFGIWVETSNDCEIFDNIVKDFDYTTTETDDAITGIYVQACVSAKVYGNTAKNLGYNSTHTTSASQRFSRGFSFSANDSVEVWGNYAYYVDQGFDTSGGPAVNQNFIMYGNHAVDCGTWGFKFANTAVRGAVTGNTALRPGQAGFVCSGASDPTEDETTAFIQFTGNYAINPGASGLWTGTVCGFRVLSVPTYDASYPRGITFKDCHAQDSQASPTMKYGFYNDVSPIVYPATGYNKDYTNRLIGCSSFGQTIAFQSGFHYPICDVALSANQVVTTGTYTDVLFDTTVYDSSGMHSTTTNTNRIYIKVAGYYRVRATICLDNNSIGQRLVRLINNGSLINGSKIVQAGNATYNAYVTSEAVQYCKAGDYVSVQVYQDSGSNLNVTTESIFSAVLMSD